MKKNLQKKKHTFTFSAIALSLVTQFATAANEAELEALRAKQAEIAAKPGNSVTDRTTPLSKAKQPLNTAEYYNITKDFSYWGVQMAGDYSVYYSRNMSQFMHTQMVMPAGEVAYLDRALDPRLNDLTFKSKDGKATRKLNDYLYNGSRKQAMLMMHKGKVVFEAYPGMNPYDNHLWMSTAKTTVGLIFTQLVAEGKVDLNEMTSKYVPSLQGSPWDNIPVWATATMSSGLDFEETMIKMVEPGSWINNFHHTFLGENKTPFIEQLRTAKPLPNEKPGDVFRYSSANPMVLQFICEAVENKPFGTLMQERVWQKGGFRNPLQLHLAPDGTGIGYGMVSTTPEDMLRYAMLYTPSWNKVASEPVVTEKMLTLIRSTARVKAYEGSHEQGYQTEWFGYSPKSNGIQWDAVFEDGAMFKHGNMGQGIYVDPKRDFAAIVFSVEDNHAGVDYAPGYMRAAAKLLAGE
ncbi:serine hydrolase [Vibrio parahaemolyticus]|nr:serine hydrolase [Vibrio parahaemolyticus]